MINKDFYFVVPNGRYFFPFAITVDSSIFFASVLPSSFIALKPSIQLSDLFFTENILQTYFLIVETCV